MKKTIPFIILTGLISWALAGIMYLVGINKAGTISYNIAAMGYMLIPAIVAIILQKFVNKEPIKKPLFVSFRINRWFFVALFTPLVLIILSIGISTLFPDVRFSSSGEGMFERYSSTMSIQDLDMMKDQMAMFSSGTFFLISLLQGFLAACTLNGLFAFGEELGWRGYMLRHLSDWSFMKVSLFTGFIWGIWHFPLILMGHNYPAHPVVGAGMMIVFCMLLSPIMTYVVIKSKSVISAALFHGSINAFAGFQLVYLLGGNDLINGITGVAGFITMGVGVLGFYLFDKYVTKENIFTNPVKNFIEQV